MLMRDELSSIWESTELSCKIDSLYNRCRPYLRCGLGHFLMCVFGRFGLVRSFMVRMYGRRASEPLSACGQSLLEDIDVDDAVAKIRQDGVCDGLFLRREMIEEFLDSSSRLTCFGDGNVNSPFRYSADICQSQATQRFRLGTYTDALRRVPVLRALASDQQLLAIARRYLGTTPALIGARMWWSFAGPADTAQKVKAGQGFHYDIDGYRGLTFFFYLTDVTPSSGPHVYVRGTHTTKAWKHLVAISRTHGDDEIEKKYGADRQITLCGPPGSGFAEDIFGFHKGLHPETGDRLIVQVRYGLRAYVEAGD
jgi:hypothetical protein